MWHRIADFFRRLFGGGSDRPEPGSIPVQPPAGPVVPPVVPVVPPEPVDPPVTPPDPPVARLGLPGQRRPVVLWLAESGSLDKAAEDADRMPKAAPVTPARMALIRKYGLDRCKDLVVCGLSGYSQYGQTLRVLHDLLVNPLPSDFAAWYRKNAAGCAGWALDWEDESKYPAGKPWCLRAIKETPPGSQCWFAPQLWLEGGKPPSRRTQWDQTHAQTVADIEAAKLPALLLWQYGAKWPTWKSEMQRFRDEGYTGLMVPMNDGGAREMQTSQGYATVRDSVAIVHGAADEGLGFGLFMPTIDPARIAPTMAAIVERYS